MKNTRYFFRMLSFILVVVTLIISVILAWYDKVSSFTAIAASIITYAGLVFGAEYFDEKDKRNKDKTLKQINDYINDKFN